jgi:septal ring factor EnvC (AmiA/AmiB activator)
MSELDDLQLKKTQKEIEKLEAEARLLKRRWLLQPSYIAAILPILALCGTALIAYLNSDFKRDADAARSEIAQLKPEAERLKQRVKTLQQEEASLKSDRDQLDAQVRTLQPKATGLQKQIVELRRQIPTWRKELANIDESLKHVMPPISGNAVSVYPPPSAEAERKMLQQVINSIDALGSQLQN